MMEDELFFFCLKKAIDRSLGRFRFHSKPPEQKKPKPMPFAKNGSPQRPRSRSMALSTSTTVTQWSTTIEEIRGGVVNVSSRLAQFRCNSLRSLRLGLVGSVLLLSLMLLTEATEATLDFLSRQRARKNVVFFSNFGLLAAFINSPRRSATLHFFRPSRRAESKRFRRFFFPLLLRFSLLLDIRPSIPPSSVASVDLKVTTEGIFFFFFFFFLFVFFFFFFFVPSFSMAL